MYVSNFRITLLLLLEVREAQLMIKHVLKNFPPIPRFRFRPYTQNENAESAESFIKFLPTLSVIFTD